MKIKIVRKYEAFSASGEVYLGNFILSTIRDIDIEVLPKHMVLNNIYMFFEIHVYNADIKEWEFYSELEYRSYEKEKIIKELMKMKDENSRLGPRTKWYVDVIDWGNDKEELPKILEKLK